MAGIPKVNREALPPPPGTTSGDGGSTEPRKGGRGRSKAAPIPQPPPPLPTPDEARVRFWGHLYAGLFGVVAGRRGDHWQLSETEQQQLGEATEMTVMAYAPALERPELILLASVIMVVGPRIVLDYEASRAKAVAPPVRKVTASAPAPAPTAPTAPSGPPESQPGSEPQAAP